MVVLSTVGNSISEMETTPPSSQPVAW
jgi:hypothetical protein